MSFTFRNPFHTQETIIRSADNADMVEEDYFEEEQHENEEPDESIDTWVQSTAAIECCSKSCLQGKEDLLKVHRLNWMLFDKPQRQMRAQTILFCCRRPNQSNPNGREVLEYALYPFDSICITAFCKLLGYSHRTLKRWLSHFKQFGFKSIQHGNINKSPSHAFTEVAKTEIRQWMIDFAKREGEERPGRFNNGRIRDINTVIPPQHTIVSIYRLYMSDSERPVQEIGYDAFRLLFHNLPIKIESPKSDVCDECSQIKLDISQCEEESRLMVLNESLSSHLREARLAREEYRVDSRMEEFMHISFDFAQNLWLPHLANQPSAFYFASLLNVCLFGILDEKSDIQTNYIYSEAEGKKGSNNVISMLLDYFFTIEPSKRRKIVFHCDNCTGQNKNNCMLKMLCWLVQMDYANEIYLKFMVRGHTKFGPDRHFGMIKKRFEKQNCYTIAHIQQTINESSVLNRSKVFPSRRFKQYREPLDAIFNDLVGISGYQCFWLSSEWKGKVKVRKSVTGSFSEIRVAKEAGTEFQFTPVVLQKPGLKAIKQKELYTKVRQFVPDEYKDELCPIPIVAECIIEPPIVAGEAQIRENKIRRQVTPLELQQLQNVFIVNKTPNKSVLENLAYELQWEVKRVRAWFNNRKRK